MAKNYGASLPKIWITATLRDRRKWKGTTSSGAANRSRSEVYGYVIPLHPTLHPNGAMFKRTKENLKIDKYLKQRCQRDYEKNHGSRADFIKEFGESYL